MIFLPDFSEKIRKFYLNLSIKIEKIKTLSKINLYCYINLFYRTNIQMSLEISVLGTKKSLSSILGNSNESSKETTTYKSQNQQFQSQSIHTQQKIIEKKYDNQNDRFQRDVFSRPNVKPSNTQSLQARVNMANSYDRNSLAWIVECLKTEVMNRGLNSINQNLHSSDIELLKNFKTKFTNYQNNWNGLMGFMMKNIVKIDDKYMLHNFFGIKEIVVNQIINISLSYILIGAPIENEIKLFILNTVPLAFNTIHVINTKISKINRTIEELSSQKQYNSYTIQEFESEIKTNPKIKNNHTKEKLLKLHSEQKSLSEKINKLSGEKDIEQSMINNEIYKLVTGLSFNYFMHDDWCPPLDNNIIKETQTKSNIISLFF
ncbi:hypothetical protein MIMI_L711 [Acanthamoeba polyphaga mimivirus]|jgi:hypothetical protein|uniref:Uncharacterized protein L711 n=6 Tax=Mimivirus TaxID=315393 RepID=YL711_MIMIV|nr:RecName: Full=Uncharacterized protein L711 [Acanthamoeba polyphaga mimivirus]AAV50971.1 unknown [Acanthamoeba polyphaga mimivirus]AEJ34955.1 hypothetical protein MIMI_L711 [Acanthamoeba polyphaga mimivirus]AHA45123.1 hypothetical protein HIRU_S217 [Hirudovirus strain Sangsue]ALR84334.1 hypothetical protein [Niemeyer virus]